MSNNELDDMCIKEKSFENSEFSDGLTDLYLSKNQIKSVDFVRNLKHLKTVDLSYNQIESISEIDSNFNIFSSLIFLEHVDLNGNLKLELPHMN